MKFETCPKCKGKGFIRKKDTTGNPYADHFNRKLPLDFYCSKCKKMVTKSHAGNGYHKEYVSPILIAKEALTICL